MRSDLLSKYRAKYSLKKQNILVIPICSCIHSHVFKYDLVGSIQVFHTEITLPVKLPNRAQKSLYWWPYQKQGRVPPKTQNPSKPRPSFLSHSKTPFVSLSQFLSSCSSHSTTFESRNQWRLGPWERWKFRSSAAIRLSGSNSPSPLHLPHLPPNPAPLPPRTPPRATSSATLPPISSGISLSTPHHFLDGIVMNLLASYSSFF